MRWIAAVVASLALSAVASAAPDAADRIPVSITWDAKIPARDGVKLSATIYRDPKQTQKVPAIVTTPYMDQARLRVRISVDQPDTDVYASLYEVLAAFEVPRPDAAVLGKK